MIRITIILLCLLTIQVSFAQTYKDKPWELVGKKVASTEVQAFLTEMGPTSDIDTQEYLYLKNKEYKRWASKGISIAIDPYHKMIIEVYLHKNTKNFSPYPHSLFKDLSFEDKQKKILAKLDEFRMVEFDLSIYGHHEGTFRLDQDSFLFLGIETEKSSMKSPFKGDIQYIRHYIDLEKMYKAEKDKKGWYEYGKISSDSAWGEMIQLTFDDLLFRWANLDGRSYKKNWGSDYNYEDCNLPNPTDRKSKIRRFEHIIIPLWDNKILLTENTDSVQNKMFAEMNYQAGTISDKIGRYFFDRSARFEITGDWYNVKDADVSETFVRIWDRKLNYTQTIRLYMYTVKDEKAINIYYDLYIYIGASAYDKALKKD